MVTTEQLLAQYRAGDADGSELFVAHVLEIFDADAHRMRRSVGLPPSYSTRDLAQHSLLRAFAGRVFERMADGSRGAVRRIVATIVRRTAIETSRSESALKRGGFQTPVSLAGENAIDAVDVRANDPSRTVEFGEWIERARAWLSEHEWNALVHVAVFRESFAKAAERMHCSREAVHDAITRVRVKFRAREAVASDSRRPPAEV